jgi:hypothetical protein
MEVDNGVGRLWRLTIKSEGALSLSTQFSHFEMPEHGQFWVSSANDVIGAFTHLNMKDHLQFATTPLQGDSLTLEYYQPMSGPLPRFNITSVVHGYRNIFGGSLGEYHDSGSCNVNTICSLGDDWRDEIRGVAMILTGGGSRLCSGSMINNARQDGRQLFLTANHCCEADDPSRWILMFNYFSPVCDYNKESDGSTKDTVQGTKKLSAVSYSDFCLLEIQETIPKEYNVFLNGFNAVEEIPTNPWCIHHPSADVKKISNSLYQVKSSGYSTATGDSHWWVTQYNNGTTEPGSSGSPLFDSNHRIVGQLHGGQAYCDYNFNDYYGKVSQSWAHDTKQQLQPFLDPDNKGVKSLDGKNLY